jgi:RNA polymerase sigma-70 factor (ECF subfamily)
LPTGRFDVESSAVDDPESAAIRRETIELALMAALQVLPPRQRAVFIARELVGLNPSETADLLDTTVEAVNSLVQRARSTVRANHAPTPPPPASEERALLDRYLAAHEAGDYDAMVALLHRDVVLTMPPEEACTGRDAASRFFRELFDPEGPGEWRLIPVEANRQPATANYLRAPGSDEFVATSVDVVRVEDGRIVTINSFLDPSLFARFGLPSTYPSTEGEREG